MALIANTNAAQAIDQGLGQILDGIVGKAGDMIDGGINTAGGIIGGGFGAIANSSRATLSGIISGFLATQPGASPGQSALPTQPANSLGLVPIGKETSLYDVCPGDDPVHGITFNGTSGTCGLRIAG